MNPSDNFDKSTFTNNPHQKRVEKPWGYEIHWVPEDKPYMGKIIHIKADARLSLQLHDKKQESFKADARLSLQLHDKKQESWLIMAGRAKVVWENEKGELIETELQPGMGYTCALGQKHRLCGITDCDVIEVSTPEIGTTYRLEDDYKRPDETEDLRKKERE